MSRMLVACNVCDDLTLTDFNVGDYADFYRGLRSTSAVDPNMVMEFFQTGEKTAQYSQPRSTTAPKHTPDLVARTYEDAVKALNAGAFEPAAMAFRKVLDLATKSLGGQHRNLRPRLDELRNEGLLTDTLHKWSQRLAIDGNEATHEAPDTPQHAELSARELMDYAELFLKYVFEMPGRVEARFQAALLDAEAAEESMKSPGSS